MTTCARRRRRGGGLPAAMGMGVAAALLFALTFVINRVMAVQGGAWEWSACLRFLFCLPIVLVVVAARGGLRDVLESLRAEPVRWALWSTVGFGLFYAPLCMAAVTAPGWVVAATWQVTIVCGMLLAPFLYDDQRRAVPGIGVALSTVILAGVTLTQLGRHGRPSWDLWAGTLPVLVAAVAYPVGNRKTMDLAGERLDAFQRLLAMTIASLPFWLLIAAAGAVRAGAPPAGQLAGTATVALCSGAIATGLYFSATQRAQHHPLDLAAVEATTAGEVVFVALLEPLALHDAAPSPISWAGIAITTIGVLAYMFTGRPERTASAKPSLRS